MFIRNSKLEIFRRAGTRVAGKLTTPLCTNLVRMGQRVMALDRYRASGMRVGV